ncbi:MAG: response regulator [Defluviitaleaceae bacterium]|nr:response regulator [Defluviitaleaceae bacterium]
MDNYGLQKLNKYLESSEDIKNIMEFVFRKSSLVISVWSSNFELLYASEEVIKRYGFSSTDEYIANFDKSSPKFQKCGRASKDLAIFYLSEALKIGTLYFEWLHRNIVTNEVIPSEVHCYKYRIKSVDVIITYAIDHRNITKHYEETKRWQEHIRHLFEFSPTIIEYYDKDLNILDVNMHGVKTFGFENKEEYIKNYDNVFFNTVRGVSSKSHFEKSLKFALQNGKCKFEFVCKKKNGETIYLYITAVRMVIEKSTIIIAYSNDITYLKKIFKELKTSYKRVNKIVENMPISCFTIDKNYIVKDCNREFLKLFGFDKKRDAIDSLNENLKSINPILEQKNFEIAFDSGKYSVNKNVNFNKATIPVEISLVSIPDSNNSVLITYIQDLSLVHQILKNKENIKNLKEESEIKSRFFARVSHEIRTPISSVLGISDQCMQKNLDPEILGSFQRINTSSKILLRLVNDILDFSRIKAGKLNIYNQKYSTEIFINEAIQTNIITIKSKPLNFEIQIDPDLPTEMIGDYQRNIQCITNILTNAFKYTKEGHVKLLIRYERNKGFPEKILLVITIEDTGYGMTNFQIKSIKNDFIRFNENIHKNIEGTGLGLNIVSDILKLMNGTMSIESKINEGTRVKLKIPQFIEKYVPIGINKAKNLQNISYIAKSQKVDLNFSTIQNGTFLICDDLETNLYVMIGYLKKYNINLEMCTSGEEVINKIKNGKVYDIIFMDYMMPNLDGIETTKIIRSKNYKGIIIAFTATTSTEYRTDFLKNGFDDIIEKPINQKELDKLLNKYIRSKNNKNMLKSNNKSFDFDNLKDIRKTFFQEQKNTIASIENFLAKGDIKKCLGPVHNLKGTSGLISENKLYNIATVLEQKILKNEATPNCFEEIFLELKNVLKKIDTENEIQKESETKEELRQIFDTLKENLQKNNAKTVEISKKLNIPEAKVLQKQIENFENEAALVTLDVMYDIFEL